MRITAFALALALALAVAAPAAADDLQALPATSGPGARSRSR